MRGPGHVIGLLRFGSGGRDRGGAAAFLGGEVMQRLEVVRRHADHLSAGLLEIGDALAERVCFGGAAAGEGLGEEIEDDGALLELLGEVELELLSADGARGGEIGRLGADRERCSRRGQCQPGGGQSEQKIAHGESSFTRFYRVGGKSARVRSSVSPPKNAWRPRANTSSGATRSNSVRLERSFISSIGPRICAADLLPAQGISASMDSLNRGPSTGCTRKARASSTPDTAKN